MIARGSLVSIAMFAVGSSAQSEEMRHVLQQHNVYRCMHGLPNLVWDNAIAANAQSWADKKEYAHSPNDQRVINGQQCGENLAWGFPHLSGTTSSKDWYQEIQYTSPYGTATSMEDATPSGKAIGHYTQVVWAETGKLGCGKGTAQVNGNSGDFWVCQYCKAGNYAGQFQQNVPAPIKGPQQCGGSASDVPGNFPSSLLNVPAGPAPAPSPPHHASGTVAPPSSNGGLGVGMGVGMGMTDTGNFGLGPAQQASKHIVSGGFTVSGVEREAFCKSEPALNAVEQGIANRAGVPSTSVRAWCRHMAQRRLAEEIPGRQLQSGITMDYTIQVPAGTDANAVKAAIESDPQAFAALINAELAKTTSFQVALANVVARIADTLDSGESMPQDGSAVGSANLAAARNSFPTLFEVSDIIAQAPRAHLCLSVAAMLAASVAIAAGIRRQRTVGVVVTTSPQGPVE